VRRISDEADEVGKQQQRKQRPIAENESYRWILTFRAVQDAVPTDRSLIQMGDRESEIFELCAAPAPFPPAAALGLRHRAAAQKRGARPGAPAGDAPGPGGAVRRKGTPPWNLGRMESIAADSSPSINLGTGEPLGASDFAVKANGRRI
jgi:hypothetical protein